MRILQVHNFYQIPGGECAVVRAENALLASAGHQVSLFARDSSTIGDLNAAGKLWMLIRIPWNRSVIDDLHKAIHRFRPDVVHVHNVFPLLSPAVYDAFYSAGVPVVQTHHNFRVLCANGLFFVNGRLCEECLEDSKACIKHKCVRGSRILSGLYARAIGLGWRRRAFTRSITLHVALNPFFADKLVDGGIPENAIRVCGNYISSFSEKVFNKEDYFLYLGRLSPEKGLFTLIEATRQVRTKMKIAGTGPMERELRNYIESHNLNHVELLGFVSGKRKVELIGKSLALVMPSEWYENFPIAAVEAQALGTPILASEIGGLPAVVDNGETGYLFRPGHASELADLMNRLNNTPDLVRRLSAQALQTAKVRFSPENHLRCLLEIYAEAIQASP